MDDSDLTLEVLRYIDQTQNGREMLKEPQFSGRRKKVKLTRYLLSHPGLNCDEADLRFVKSEGPKSGPVFRRSPLGQLVIDVIERNPQAFDRWEDFIQTIQELYCQPGSTSKAQGKQ